VHGAPGPIVGAAGLPVLAVGYGVCWLVNRFGDGRVGLFDTVGTPSTQRLRYSLCICPGKINKVSRRTSPPIVRDAGGAFLMRLG
jgi:hypothetical protein